MNTSLVSLAVTAILVAAVSFLCVERSAPTQPITPPGNVEGTKMLGRLPVAFVPNVGQWEPAARYVARVGQMTVFLEEKGWTFRLVEQTAQRVKERGMGAANENVSARGVAVRMTFASASAPELVAEDRLSGRHNYFLGSDPSRWRCDVPLYSAVCYRGLHPGIDVRAREHDGHFEYDLLLGPDADLEPVVIAVEGIERMDVDEAGDLVMATKLGPVRMPAPMSWEEGPSGERSLVTCRYVLRGADRFGFEVARRRPGWALVVDPGLVWSTFLGANGTDMAYALALGPQGEVTVAGYTDATGFPTTPGAFDTIHGGIYDVFLTRLSPSGTSLVWSTFVGGTGNDQAYCLALDAQGAATVSGQTTSSDFPTTPGAFDTTHGGLGDAFVTRLSPTGSSLVFSTFLGGTSIDMGGGIAVDAQGATTCAGVTQSADFPTTPGAFDTTINSLDGFVAQLSPLGTSLVFSTFLGGTGADSAGHVAVDGQGTITVIGQTQSSDFPTTPGAFDTSYGGLPGHDAFVTRFTPLGTSLVYSTFLGGSWYDRPADLALDAQGGVTVTGDTSSIDFPTTPGAFDTTAAGNDAFVARLSPSGASLDYSTYLGGSSGEYGIAVALDAQGGAVVVGYTGSTDYPTTPGAYDRTNSGTSNITDAFVTRLSPQGSSLIYSTLLGGTGGHDQATGIALDAYGVATVVGQTGPADFPTTPGAFSTVHSLLPDGFVARLDLLPTGVTAFGNSSPGCTGLLPISVQSMPQVGNTSFAVTCGNAPPNAPGLILFTGSAFASPLVVVGLEVWVDPSLMSVSGSANSNSIGASNAPVPIPNAPALAGVRLFAQFAWAGPNSPLPCPLLGFSASNALDFTIQP